MQKDFDKWNNKKKSIHVDKMRPHFHIREVWFCHLGVNVGFEQDGVNEEALRPVAIIRKFNNEVCWVVPLTHTEKRGKYYLPIGLDEGSVSVIILSQIRLLDSKRLKYKAGYLSEEDFKETKNRLRDLLS